MTTMKPDDARETAKLCEALADRIEASPPGEPDRDAEYAIAALLVCPAGTTVYGHKTGRLLVDKFQSPTQVPKPWAGAARGLLAKDFTRSLALAVALAEKVFDGWGYDFIKWGRDVMIPASAEVIDGVPQPLPEDTYDAEIMPLVPTTGRSLVGQHHTPGGAMLAAILRGYAFKVLFDANALAPVEVDFDLSDEERAFINDIVDRAEELELSSPAARVDRMMDIAAVHKCGCALDLESFLHRSTDFAFTHDFTGIVENIDRTTGKLGGEFSPKYAAVEVDYAAIEARIMAHAAAETPGLADIVDKFGGPTGRRKT